MGLLHKYQNGYLYKYIIYSKKSPTGPTERTPKREYLIAPGPRAISILNQKVLHLLNQVVIKIRPENRIKKKIKQT